MFKGKIVLLSSEDVLPYDRPKLSKKLDASAADLELVGSAWYAEAEVEVQLGVEVVQAGAYILAILLGGWGGP